MCRLLWVVNAADFGEAIGAAREAIGRLEPELASQILCEVMNARRGVRNNFIYGGTPGTLTSLAPELQVAPLTRLRDHVWRTYPEGPDGFARLYRADVAELVNALPDGIGAELKASVRDA